MLFREKASVEKYQFHLKDSPVAISQDFLKHIQDIRRKVLVQALQKIKKESPRAKASVIGNRLNVNGTTYFQYDVPKEWLPTIIPIANGSTVNTQPQKDNDQEKT